MMVLSFMADETNTDLHGALLDKISKHTNTLKTKGMHNCQYRKQQESWKIIIGHQIRERETNAFFTHTSD